MHYDLVESTKLDLCVCVDSGVEYALVHLLEVACYFLLPCRIVYRGRRKKLLVGIWQAFATNSLVRW
jgi:hypothetical protein